MHIITRDPCTGTILEVYDYHTSSYAQGVLSDLAVAQRSWMRQGIQDRCKAITQLSTVLSDYRTRLARLMTSEMGKPLKESLAEIDKCITLCSYYSAEAPSILATRSLTIPSGQAIVSYAPLGVVLGIMPWNFPAWQAIRFLVPTVLAGNAVILKHAEQVTGSAMLIERICKEAGLGELMRSLRLDHDQIRQLIPAPELSAVSLTGSTRAGSIVAEQAGRHLKPCVLELGGSDPCLVMEDADLEHAVTQCLAGRLRNAGQSCISPKRILVHESLHEAFVDALLSRIAMLRVGDPFDENTDMGPMARIELRDHLHDQVGRSLDLGARCLAGGSIPDRKGAFYPPTLLIDVRPGMPAFDEELFGPVWCVTKVADEHEAISMANKTSYGLGASIISSDKQRALDIAMRDIQSGSCFINQMVASHPRLPFGGVKMSGHGRELGPEGLISFCNIRTIVVAGH